MLLLFGRTLVGYIETEEKFGLTELLIIKERSTRKEGRREREKESEKGR
jgi:hypothetical protein